MNLAALQKFAPLFPLLGKQSGELSDDELGAVSLSLTGDANSEFTILLKRLRDSEPGSGVLELLGSPTARKLFLQLNESNRAAAMEPVPLFVRCPACDTRFETEILP